MGTDQLHPVVNRESLEEEVASPPLARGGRGGVQRDGGAVHPPGFPVPPLPPFWSWILQGWIFSDGCIPGEIYTSGQLTTVNLFSSQSALVSLSLTNQPPA